MANCHNIFKKFNESITLSEGKVKSLKRSRKSLREKIRKYMSEEKKDEIKPNFYSQGSFPIGTAINPIIVDGKQHYDLDDGVYFKCSKNDRKATTTYHKWIKDAVDDHTDEDVIDKNTCVRVPFSDGHHIDLPIYFIDVEKDDAIPELATKSDSWIESDPKAFSEWLKEKKCAQSIRLIKYTKAWLDFQSQKHGKMPSGFIMTILILNNYITDDRDDISFLETLKCIDKKIKDFVCKRPTTDKKENLFDSYSENQKDKFKKQLELIINDGDKAINNMNQKTSCEMWQKHLGDRLPCNLAKDELETANSYSKPAVIKSSAKSA